MDAAVLNLLKNDPVSVAAGQVWSTLSLSPNLDSVPHFKCDVPWCTGVATVLSKGVRHPVTAENGRQGRDGRDHLPARMLHRRQL